MTSSTNERAIKRRREQATADRRNDDLVTQELMSTKHGRRWVWNRLEESMIFGEDMNFDAGYMAFRKGERKAGLRLLKDVQAFTPNEYILMTNEAQDVESSLQQRDPNYVGTDEQPDD